MLEALLGGRVHRIKVRRVDLVEATTTVEVRYELPALDHQFCPHRARRRGGGLVMRNPRLRELLDHLPAIELGDLESAAALLTRRDRKYVVPAETAEHLVAALDGRCRVLEIEGRRRFRYESVYFDTPGRASYLGAARRRPRRYKVRTRAYLDTGHCALEIKTRGAHGQTIKQQHDHQIDRRDRLDAEAREIVAVPARSSATMGRRWNPP